MGGNVAETQTLEHEKHTNELSSAQSTASHSENDSKDQQEHPESQQRKSSARPTINQEHAFIKHTLKGIHNNNAMSTNLHGERRD